VSKESKQGQRERGVRDRRKEKKTRKNTMAFRGGTDDFRFPLFLLFAWVKKSPSANPPWSSRASNVMPGVALAFIFGSEARRQRFLSTFCFSQVANRLIFFRALFLTSTPKRRPLLSRPPLPPPWPRPPSSRNGPLPSPLGARRPPKRSKSSWARRRSWRAERKRWRRV
jgi:hypothetical protein